MINKIKHSQYYYHYLNSRQLNLSDFGLKINNKRPEEKVFSMKEHKIIESDVPVFTIIECPYDYNPEAKGLLIDKFLYDSLEVKGNPEETKQKVKGVKQIIGYLFKSGKSFKLPYSL